MSFSERMATARAARLPRVGDSQSRRGARAGRAKDPFGELRTKVHQALLDDLGPKLYDADLALEDLEGLVHQALLDALRNNPYPMTQADRARLIQAIADDILGYGPIEPFLRDEDVSEIMVNGPEQVYVERSGRLYQVDAHFMDDEHLRRTIDKIVGKVGRRIDESSPMVDARLTDGSRVNAVVPPLAVDGSLLTIRKFSTEPLTAEDLIGFGTLTRPVVDFLRACVTARLNILVSGGTGAGKTTTLNVLSHFIPDDERIITIEDAAELRLRQQHVLRLESRPPNIEGKGEIRIRELVRNSLRMRPDRIVVGEVRDAAALDMLQAMNTGHDGGISTVHANSPRDMLSRLETMVLLAGVELPIRAVREQVASAIDLVVHQSRMKDGSRRITHITEVAGMEGDIITMQDLFVLDHGAADDAGFGAMTSHPDIAVAPAAPTLVPTGLRPAFLPQLMRSGVPLDPAVFTPPAGVHVTGRGGRRW